MLLSGIENVAREYLGVMSGCLLIQADHSRQKRGRLIREQADNSSLVFIREHGVGRRAAVCPGVVEGLLGHEAPLGFSAALQDRCEHGTKGGLPTGRIVHLVVVDRRDVSVIERKMHGEIQFCTLAWVEGVDTTNSFAFVVAAKAEDGAMHAEILPIAEDQAGVGIGLNSDTVQGYCDRPLDY